MSYFYQKQQKTMGRRGVHSWMNANAKIKAWYITFTRLFINIIA